MDLKHDEDESCTYLLTVGSVVDGWSFRLSSFNGKSVLSCSSKSFGIKLSRYSKTKYTPKHARINVNACHRLMIIAE